MNVSLCYIIVLGIQLLFVVWLLHIGCRNRRQKPKKSVNGKCKHRLVFSRNCQDNRGNVFPIYKCEKCGYEQIGKEHLRLEEYEN